MFAIKTFVRHLTEYIAIAAIGDQILVAGHIQLAHGRYFLRADGFYTPALSACNIADTLTGNKQAQYLVLLGRQAGEALVQRQ